MPSPVSPTTAVRQRRPAVLQPLDAGLHVPTAQRMVRAKSRQLEPDSEIQPHSHGWAQVAISISGVARVTAGHTTYLVPAWRAVWIPPDEEHTVTVLEATQLRTLYVYQRPDRPGPDVPAAQSAAWRQCRVLEVSPLLRELVMQMDVDTDGGAPPADDMLARERRLGDLVLDELRRAAPVHLGIELPQDKRLRALCEAMLADPARHTTLDGWVSESAASARTVARLFREQLGTSFGRWRQQVLLARALTLAAKGRPMGLIANELGYTSPSAFSAMVRRAVGQPPSRFFLDVR